MAHPPEAPTCSEERHSAGAEALNTWGKRLENNILVTRDDPIDLFKDIPVEADAVEELMSRRKVPA
ncbi:MAG: hypothetical protein IT228_11750 [Flavobacteriales bacterium]|nr:hypothetical protein [Flavobacteriales bacterium]NUQ14180.1 hypothetical protein [Flavobacteriales bacterium]